MDGMRDLFIVALVLTRLLVLGQQIQCTLEKSNFGEHCVFRDVNVAKNTAGAILAYPLGVAKPSQVAFVDSNMQQLPSNFLNLAGPELKVLRVENCGLASVTIPIGLEELYAKSNSIEKVIVRPSGSERSLRILDLSGNELTDFSNVTKCQALEVLNLSGNKFGEVLDLGQFRGLNKLRKLDVSHSEISYLDNTDNVNLESLEDLDLSHNNILPSDLNIAIFYPYSKLHTLRLNNNLMTQLDYNHLLKIKSLKTVYLDGNNFKCNYLDSMLNHLQQNDLQTPPGERSSCPDKTFRNFCCTGPLPTKPTPPRITQPTVVNPTVVDPTEPQTRTTTDQPNAGHAEESGSTPSWEWIAVGAGIVVVAVIAAVIGVVIWKKKTGSNYRAPPENLEL